MPPRPPVCTTAAPGTVRSGSSRSVLPRRSIVVESSTVTGAPICASATGVAAAVTVTSVSIVPIDSDMFTRRLRSRADEDRRRRAGLEAFGRGLDLIAAFSQRVEHEIALAVALRFLDDLALAQKRDGCSGYSRAERIDDGAFERRVIRGGRGNHTQAEAQWDKQNQSSQERPSMHGSHSASRAAD